MTESEILRWSALSAAVFFFVILLFALGGVILVIVAATMIDVVLRRVETHRTAPVQPDDRRKL